jgi:hypothetical protein
MNLRKRFGRRRRGRGGSGGRSRNRIPSQFHVHVQYQELTEIAAQWKDKEQRLTVVERAMMCPSSQEEESKPAKTKKLALPHWERTPHAMQRPHGHQVLLLLVGKVFSKASAQEQMYYLSLRTCR